MRVKGMLVDCVFFEPNGKRGTDEVPKDEKMKSFDNEMSALQHPSGDPIFRKTHAKESKL